MIRVGLSTYVEDARWGVWDQAAALLPATYVETVATAGGVPVLLPPIVPGDFEDAAATAVAGIDALVLTGGPDVAPDRYGADAHAETDRPRGARDAWELALLDAALGAVPVLAVCRGAQLLNVARGGTLHQHLPDVSAHGRAHRPEPGRFGGVPVKVAPGSLLAGIVGDQVSASCHHHQAIDRLGDGLVVTGQAPDGTIEAVEAVEGDHLGWVLGVQWHPEQDHDTRLFAALIDAAAAR